jgi:hypothetical protein
VKDFTAACPRERDNCVGTPRGLLVDSPPRHVDPPDGQRHIGAGRGDPTASVQRVSELRTEEQTGQHTEGSVVRTQRRPWVPTASRLPIIGGTLLLLAVSVGFLINTPSLIGPDEPYHFDRVVAAAHGNLVPDAGELPRSQGARFVESTFARTQMKRNAPSWAEFPPIPRDQRPSLNDLGGNQRPADAVSNYLTQHPPLYYDLMGAAMWLLPDADGMPADKLVFLLRAFNVLMILALPALFWAAAIELFGPGPITATAAFLPVLIPGIARTAATINNDNLCIVIGAAIIWRCLSVMRGDRTVRTAAWLSGLALIGSLTKLTVMTVVLFIVVAYLVRVVRDRRLPPLSALAVLISGGILSCLWWIRNVIKFGHLVPESQAWGSRWATTVAPPRPPDKPADIGYFWDQIGGQVPLRFWGSLGLHEPPQLPWPMLLILSASAVLAVLIAVLVSRGVRWELTIIWLLGMAVIALMVNESLGRYTEYTVLAGIQGRYVYPAAVGLLLPFAVTVVSVLRRQALWAPVVMAIAATIVGGWAFDLSIGYTWLHRFETLTPLTLGRAISTLSGHFPYSAAVLTALMVIAVVAWVGSIVAAVRWTMLSRASKAEFDTGTLSAPDPTEADHAKVDPAKVGPAKVGHAAPDTGTR